MISLRCLLLAAGLACVLGFVTFWRALPDPLFSASPSSVLEARDGRLLAARIAEDGQWRFPVRDSLPSKYVEALLTYEDKRFRQHPGVDPLALARSFVLNLRNGEVVSGGSTISMQVLRLARGNPNRTYLEKAVEILLALRLELSRSKDEILSLYAAHAPFGGNVVGLEAASWRYFGRGPDLLSWAEASTLAVLPNNPALVHPGRNREALRNKRNSLLERLHARGTIDEMTLRSSLQEPLPTGPRSLPQLAPHLLETMNARNPSGIGRYRTTVSLPVQSRVRQIVTRHAAELGRRQIHNVAALVIDNETFETVAYVGNSRWDAGLGRGYAIDLVHRPRSTGSLLKPFLFAGMLDAGHLLPGTLVPDLPTQIGGYAPENFDRTYRGAVPAKQALARSMNVPAVRMLREYGVGRLYDDLVQAGVTTLHRPPDGYGLTLVLGGAEGTLWELTALYANLAHVATRSGTHRMAARRTPTALAGRSTNLGRARLSTGAAWLTLEALFDVVRPGVDEGWRTFAGSQRIAWKTGTSFGQRDGWAIGSSARYTVGVWTGNATGEGVPGLTGIAAAAPVLFDLFGILPAASWPDRPLDALKQVRVCADDGFLSVNGCRQTTGWAPRHSHFESVSPYQALVHLDASRTWRVHGQCESVSSMEHETWFVLTAGQEYYYHRSHPTYRKLPPYRTDCMAKLTADGAVHDGPIDFLYPMAGSRVYIPTELNGNRGRVVFEAAHRDPAAELFWHVDNRYLGTTTTFHQQAVDLKPGRHVVAVVDRDGHRAVREFEVLGPHERSR